MGELNEAQARHLVTTFKHVDEVLSGARDAIRRSDSPFAPCIQDMPPARSQMLERQLRELRAAMVRLLKREGIPGPSPSTDASWAWRTAIVSARIDIEELRPRYLKGYGEASERAAAALNEIVRELLAKLDRMEAGRPPPHKVGGPETHDPESSSIQPKPKGTQ